jgi:hypothetical protein
MLQVSIHTSVHGPQRENTGSLGFRVNLSECTQRIPFKTNRPPKKLNKKIEKGRKERKRV